MLFLLRKKISDNQFHPFHQRSYHLQKKSISHKPDSVFSFARFDKLSMTKENGYHLSGPNIAVRILLPTLQRSRQFLDGIKRAAFSADIRGITAHKVYPLNTLLHKTVGSYPTFSPLPQWLIRAVIFCGTCCVSPLVILRQAQYDKRLNPGR